jgi:hypothetical protein
MTPIAPAKPAIFATDATTIPAELRDQRAWIAWKLDWRDQQWSKVPVIPVTGSLAKVDDPSTWPTYVGRCGAFPPPATALALPAKEYTKNGERACVRFVEFVSREVRQTFQGQSLAAFDAYTEGTRE